MKTPLLVTTVLAALAVAAGTARAGGPVVTAGTGCSVQCISKALVTTTATAAKVELATTAPASLLVYAAGRTVSVTASSPLKVAFFTGLEPDTSYTIVVTATDLQGRKQVRQGSFRTLKVETTGHAAPVGVDSGLGCAAQCIDRALFTQTKPTATLANIDIGTST